MDDLRELSRRRIEERIERCSRLLGEAERLAFFRTGATAEAASWQREIFKCERELDRRDAEHATAVTEKDSHLPPPFRLLTRGRPSKPSGTKTSEKPKLTNGKLSFRGKSHDFSKAPAQLAALMEIHKAVWPIRTGVDLGLDSRRRRDVVRDINVSIRKHMNGVIQLENADGLTFYRPQPVTSEPTGTPTGAPTLAHAQRTDTHA